MANVAVSSRESGVALITVLLIVAIVATVVAFVGLQQQVWMRQMQNVSDRLRGDMLQQGAVAWAGIILADDLQKSKESDHLGELWAQKMPPLPVEGGAIAMAITDGQARFNLNNLLRGNVPSTHDIGVFQRLLESLRLDTGLGEVLVDWLDADSQARPGGAEDIEYLNLDPPYRPGNNQLLTSVDELRLVRGFTAETVEALRPFVTVLPRPADININTASPELVAALVPGLSVNSASQILSDRERNPFKDTKTFIDRLPKGTSPPQAGVGVKSGYFLVMLDIAIGRHHRRTEALVERSSDGKTALVWQRPQPVILTTDESGPEETAP